MTDASTAARSSHSDQLGILTQTRILAEKGLTQETVDIFRDHGAAWRKANAGHVSLGQMKVMSAIEHCRTAALGGHVARCENDKCAHMVIVYNSCRNRHCPKCQGAAAKAMARRA